MAPSDQIFLFVGENTYALTQERRRWQTQFAEKHGAENLRTLTSAEVTLQSLLDDISIAPFLAEKRLVVVNGIPKFTAEDIEQLEKSIHPSSLLLFYDPKPDKRLVGTKALLKIATVKEFPHLSEKVLQNWLVQEAHKRGTTLSSSVATVLTEQVGAYEQLLSQELEKLALYKLSAEITAEDIRALAIPSAEQEIWTLTQLLSQGKKNEALLFVHAQIERGEDAFAIWNMLLWFLRQLVSTWIAVSAGNATVATLASDYKVPFPTAKILLGAVRSIDRMSLESFLKQMIQYDLRLKTGGHKATQEAPEELRALIDSFVMNVPFGSR